MKTVDIPCEKVFFTSDLHFGHEWLIDFNNRPFADVCEMDASLVRNWNATVPTDGLVFVLGDIGVCSNERIIEIFEQLHGEKILIRGNHDPEYYSEQTLGRIFSEVHDLLYLRLRDYTQSIYYYMVLCHYPMLDWQSSYRGVWQLFGHIHTRGIPEFNTVQTRLFAEQYDVGVDNNNYRPISFPQLRRIIQAQQTQPQFKRSNYYTNEEIKEWK